MAVKVIDSNRARALWREILDKAQAGGEDVVVERYGKPVAAVIAYEDFIGLQDELDDLRAARRAGAAYEEWKREPGRAVPYEIIRADLAAEGLLDE
jgi:prevent-host-death family protein